MNADEKYMHMALELANKAEGMTSPNPLVGAVIVKDGRICGKGYHKKCGSAHAEVNAIEDAGGKNLKGAVLYVTLEPCDHFGRTPPCTDAIIKSGITKVIIGMKDPNPINNGKGILRLKRSGMKVSCGTLQSDAEELNKPYIKFITKKTPYVTVKIAESIDGKIATKTGDSRWVTSEDSRDFVHYLRGTVDAVMIGANTVLTDDPILLSKTSKSKQPMRIIVDSSLKTPIDSKLFMDIRKSQVLIATTKNAISSKIKLYEAMGIRFIVTKLKCGMVDLRDLFKKLGKMNITHVLVEGGGALVASLIEEKLVDKLLFFIAPKIVGGKDAPTSVEGKGISRMKEAVLLKNIKIKNFKQDILIEAEVA